MNALKKTSWGRNAFVRSHINKGFLSALLFALVWFLVCLVFFGRIWPHFTRFHSAFLIIAQLVSFIISFRLLSYIPMSTQWLFLTDILSLTTWVFFIDTYFEIKACLRSLFQIFKGIWIFTVKCTHNTCQPIWHCIMCGCAWTRKVLAANLALWSGARHQGI